MFQMVSTEDSHISVFIFSYFIFSYFCAFCSLPFSLLNTDPTAFFRQFYFFMLTSIVASSRSQLWGLQSVIRCFCVFCFMRYSPSQAMAIFTDPVLLTHIDAFVIACAVQQVPPPFCHLTNDSHSESCQVRKCRVSHVLLLQYSYVKDEYLYFPYFCRKKKAL